MELPQEELNFQQPKTADLGYFRTAVPEEGFDEGPEDFEADDLEFPPRSRPAVVAESESDLAARLMTAADLANRSDGGAITAIQPSAATLNVTRASSPENSAALARVSPEVFHQGMIVRHPQYGLGKIVALSGSGIKRKATVVFAAGAGEKRFLLMHSPLRPAAT
jgi:hypothetical protein